MNRESDNPVPTLPLEAISGAAWAMAQRFHETYERLAPLFEYVTRAETAKPWCDVPVRNRQLMAATCQEVISHRSDELYDAYLMGCEDECVPEPLSKEVFMRKFTPRTPLPEPSHNEPERPSQPPECAHVPAPAVQEETAANVLAQLEAMGCVRIGDSVLHQHVREHAIRVIDAAIRSHVPASPAAEIDAQFAGMATDAKYQAEAKKLAGEFSSPAADRDAVLEEAAKVADDYAEYDRSIIVRQTSSKAIAAAIRAMKGKGGGR